MEKIVVGVDGSEAASAAVRWAADEAVHHGCRLVAVHAWSLPAMMGSAFAPGIAEEIGDLEIAAKEGLATALRSALGAEYLDTPIDEVVVRGSAVEALLHHAAGARLLVVGSRGHGGFAGLLLGSVSQQCAHHSPCPVVVVPYTAK